MFRKSNIVYFFKKNEIVFFLVLGIVLIFIFTVAQIIDYSLISEIKINEIEYSNDFDWEIDLLKIDRNYTSIGGWAYKDFNDPYNFNIEVVLKNLNNDQAIVIPTQMRQINDQDEDGTSPTINVDSGFVARINNRLLEMNESSYLIILLFQKDENQYLIDTGQIIN